MSEKELEEEVVVASGEAGGAEGSGAEVASGGESPSEGGSWEDDPDYAGYSVLGNSSSGSGGDGDTRTLPLSEYESLMSDAVAYRELRANPSVLAAVMHFQAGGTVEQLVGTVDTTDYRAMDGRDLYLMDLRRKYGKKITQEMEEDALDAWDNMSSFQKLDKAETLAEKFENEKTGKASAFTKSIQEYQQEAKAVSDRLTQDFEGVLQHWAKKGSYFGMSFDEHKVAKLRQFVKDCGGNIILEDGKPSAKRYFQALMGVVFQHDIARAKKLEGVQRAVETTVSQVSNTGQGAGSSVPGNPGASAPAGNAYELFRRKQKQSAK